MEQSDTVVIHEDIVIVGAGIAGLATALGLHRLGIRSLVLESSDRLRITGFVLGIWSNGWRALDALGVGDILREKTVKIQALSMFKTVSKNSNQVPDAETIFNRGETRCVRRKDLLEALMNELPQGAVRYSSKVVSIEESGNVKLLHLADGSIVKTKVLIGCDGVNSRVAKWLGLSNPVSAGRCSIRGLVHFEDGHGFGPKFNLYLGGGVQYGIIHCDEKTLYWFCSFTPTLYKCELARAFFNENENDPMRMKQFVLSTIPNAPNPLSQVVERTKLDRISCSGIKFRLPWNILLGNIARNNICVVGDAFHPMTPEIGQGGCSALEDSVILARSIAKALTTSSTSSSNEKYNDNDEEYARKIEKGLEMYARERRLRGFSLVSMSYLVGFLQESKGVVMSFLKRMFLSRFTIGVTAKMAAFDCGKLNVS